MQRKDLLEKNAAIFETQGKALDAVASRNVKVLVVGNPANTNALICQHNAPSIPAQNFTALTRLDLNRCARSRRGRGRTVARRHSSHDGVRLLCEVVPRCRLHCVLACRSSRCTTSSSGATIRPRSTLAHARAACALAGWPAHTVDCRYPDVTHAVINDWKRSGISLPVSAVVNDTEWLQKTFIPLVQQRGAAVIKARKLSSAASAANAIVDHVRDWWLGSVRIVLSVDR